MLIGQPKHSTFSIQQSTLSISSVRVLILSTTTGYQLRSFGDAAERAGIELMFATDRCHLLDDPWRDHAVAVRFHEEDDSLAAIVEAARARPLDGVIAVGDRPVVLAARTAQRLGLAGNPPDAAA
jgi:DNA-binding LacI/PurR family transcriptional regulator